MENRTLILLVSGEISYYLPTGLAIYVPATTLPEEGTWEIMMTKMEEVLEYLWEHVTISGKNTRAYF